VRELEAKSGTLDRLNVGVLVALHSDWKLSVSEKFSYWATVAEIVSAIAIVASLIFVGIQIRVNTVTETLSTYDRLHGDLINWQMQLATNSETLNSVNAFLTGEGEGDGPLRMGNVAFLALWQIYERAYFARSYGRLGDQEWGRYQRFMCQGRLSETRMRHCLRIPREFGR
jgi:hypothetical protein